MKYNETSNEAFYISLRFDNISIKYTINGIREVLLSIPNNHLIIQYNTIFSLTSGTSQVHQLHYS